MPNLQYKAVNIEFLVAATYDDLARQIKERLEKNYLFHGDWRETSDGNYVQAMCPGDWRPMPPISEELQASLQSNILTPQPPPGRILG